MKTIMLAWIGGADHDAAAGSSPNPPGPIARAATERRALDAIHLLNNYSDRSTAAYKKWLRATTKTKARITSSEIKLVTPTDFGAIYSNVRREVDAVVEKHGRDVRLVFNLSPGTYGMAAVWIILQQTLYPDSELIEASPEAGVITVDVPFEISADYVPDLLDRIKRSRTEADRAFIEAARGTLPESPSFSDLQHRCTAMKSAIHQAERIAPRSIPVVIEGEPGTGKHLLATVIHNAGQFRSQLSRVACGAMPAEQLEQELFGVEEGTRKIRKGALERANGGTLFLGEIDTLPPMLQVKLLRALEDEEVTRVGGTRTVAVKDIRCISATSKQLNRCVAEGTFRSDLYYRLAGDVIALPPLRERTEDFELLINHILEQKKTLLQRERGLENIRLSAGAKNAIKRYHWPGNIRELENVLLRVATHSDRVEIRQEDIRTALQLAPIEKDTEILNRPFSEGFSLEEVLDEVARHYIKRANEHTRGRITRTARLLGYEHYQVLGRKMKNLGVTDDA